MGGVCESGCHRYINNVSAITSYNRCDIPAPLPMEIRIRRTDSDPDISYEIYIGRNNDFLTIKIYSKNGHYEVTNVPPGIEFIDIKSSNVTFTIYIKLIGPNIFPTLSYIKGDEYHINFQDYRCPDFANSASAQYIRNPIGMLINNLSNKKALSANLKQNDTNDNPQIIINAQTTLNGSDISDAVFTIYDEFQYYNNIIPNNECPPQPSEIIKQTIFRECCPYMVSVVKGQGQTLLEKLEYLFNEGTTTEPNIYIFYENIALYGMAKYILSRLLFGKFNINYLLGKYNDKFLQKLNTSRFCSFMTFFESEPYNHYNDYFLYKN